MSAKTGAFERPVALMGDINPDVPPLTEHENVFAVPKKSHDHDNLTEAQDPIASEKEVTDVKAGTVTADKDDSDVDEKSDQEFVPSDPFVPFNDLVDENQRIITMRAVVLGSACGALVNASNVYLGLKSGWTFGASLFGSIIGFAVLRPLSKALPKTFPVLGGDFGPRENNIVQTAATAAGGLSNVFVSGIPALYQLNLLGATPKEDFPRLITLTLCGCYLGIAMSTPLRKFFIIYVARELSLIFPTPSATAMTIRAMHNAASGEAIAKLKMKALGIAFSFALILRVVSQYAIGILWDHHIFTWFFIWGKYNNSALAIENWGWYIEYTPAFIGVGMLVGLNVAVSFFMGSVLAWGIIGPALVHHGVAFGIRPYTNVTELGQEFVDRWGGVTVFTSLGSAASTKDTPSPRFWLLWPGVLILIVVSFVELGLQWRVFYLVSRAVWRGSCAACNDLRIKFNKKSSPFLEKHGRDERTNLIEDIAEDDQLVKWWMWAPMLVGAIIISCVVLGVQFGMPVGMSLLSLFLAFFFSFLAVQATGVTDVTPLTAASKASQVVLGGATKGEGWGMQKAQLLNLLGGSLASMGAGQAADLVGDFRVGFLLRTSPKQQWLAQVIGSLVAVFLAPALFMLFMAAYPCVIDLEAETCAFSGPSISAWRAMAVAVTADEFPVPPSSGIFAIVFSIFGAAMTVARHYLYKGKWEKYKVYHPNMTAIGMAFLLPQTVYGTAMVIGAVPAYIWMRRNARHFDIYGYAVAAGLIAGEGIGGVINAVFEIAGIAGPTPYGTQIACPAESC